MTTEVAYQVKETKDSNVSTGCFHWRSHLLWRISEEIRSNREYSNISRKQISNEPKVLHRKSENTGVQCNDKD